MSTIDVSVVGDNKVKNLNTGETIELGSLWKNQDVAIIFFRRWGCMLCRLWAKELGEISPVLQRHDVKLIGVGVEEENSEEFIKQKFFDGDLYCVEDLSTYQKLGFKRFNVVTIITSLFWKQSRKAISKGQSMGLSGDLKGDWVQTGGALLIKNDGKDISHFVQTGPGDHMANLDILKHFGLENEYKPESMGNKKREDATCNELLIALSLLVGGVVLEAPAPYPASGWKPSGPAFDLPARAQPQPEYLPVDPRNPSIPNNFDDNVDVSVQGLPTVEQQPHFQLSPVNGQQYSGPSVNSDISKLNPSLQQVQYQQQLQIARQFARQREYETAVARQAANGQPRYQPPGQFAQTTTSTVKPILRTPQEETTTEPLDLNEGEILDDGRNPRKQPEKVSVEITKQNIQEYPAEIFLNPFAQLKGQAQFVPLQQLGQLQNGAPILFQQVQAAESQGFDGPAHFSALPSVLAQRELLEQAPQAQNFVQNPIIVQQEPLAQPVNQYQPINQYQPVQPEIQAQYQPVQPQIQPAQYQPVQPQIQYSPVQPQYQPMQYTPVQSQIQPTPYQPGQYQPIQPAQYQPIQPAQYQPIQPGQYQPVQPQISGQYQPQVFLPQNQIPVNQYQPADPKDVEQIEPTNQQPQPQIGQAYQPQFIQPNQNQAQLIIAQPINYQNQDLDQFYQNLQQFDQSQRQTQGQGLQSGLNINQQGNDIDEEKEDQDEGSKATAVATAFGTRTQPRVVAQYGVPATDPRGQVPRRTTTESPQEQTTEDAPAIAEATAVASGRRNAKLRSRRVRPVFTLDKSGHLVLAQQ